MPAGVALCLAAVGLTLAAAGRGAARLVAARGPERWMWTILLATLATVWPVAVLGLAGWLSAGVLFGVAVGLFVLSRGVARPEPGPARRLGLAGPVGWAVGVTALVVACDLAAFLPMPPIDWDAVTYHLYLPVRWLQEGRIVHVPTVFSDNAAAFAPQNGALVFTWLLALSGRDALVNVAQLACLAFLGLAICRTGGLLAIPRSSAALAALTLVWLAPVRRWTYSGNVDVFMVAFAFGALYWQLAYLRRGDRRALVASGLAGGLALGTKALGLALVALLAAPLGVVLLWRRRLAELGIFLAGLVAGGGWWLLRNTWLYGNPLFPVHVELPFFELPGAYGTDALRAGEFHLASWREVALAVRDQFGATTCVLMALGLVVLGRRALSDLARRRRRFEAPLLLALALAWAAFFAGVVPHNDQARFALPVLVISLLGWGFLLARAGRAGQGAAFGLWLAGVAAAGWASRPWMSWSASFETLARSGVAAAGWWLTFAVCTALLAVLWLTRRSFPKPAAWTAAALTVWAAVTLATLHGDAARVGFFAGADYRAWGEGFLPFNEPAAPPARIAYSGANIPYALAGIGWRHRVVYVNTQGEADDGFYEFWSRDRRLHPYHKPGLYRGAGAPDRWLARLAEAKIDTVVLFRLHRTESRYIPSTPQGFPVEHRWVRAHPELFEPIHRGSAAEIYRVRHDTEP